MEGSFPVDLIFYAVIALVIALKLRSVLGQRTGHEQPPAEFRRDKEEREQTDHVIHLPESRIPPAPAKEPDDLPLADIGDPDVASGLAAIRNSDPSFTRKYFLEGAKTAFEMVIAAYNKRDKRTLRMLLDEPLYKEFVQLMNEEKERNAISETTLVSIEKTDIVQAGMKKNIAQISLRFLSEQIQIKRNAEGDIVEGQPDEIEEIEEVWRFERDARSPNPNWIVTAIGEREENPA